VSVFSQGKGDLQGGHGPSWHDLENEQGRRRRRRRKKERYSGQGCPQGNSFLRHLLTVGHGGQSPM